MLNTFKTTWFGKRFFNAYSFILLFAVAGLLISALYHDDYAGGEGYHIHQGFPFGWYEGHFNYGEAVMQGMSPLEYATQHPERVQWSLDYRAVVGDLFFWASVGSVCVGLWAAGIRLRKG